uniref:Uncharacterized protein n=1 Tax=Oryza glumipatula TaxID=40148 RepID=A0A0D9YAG0_9ORYZ
MTGNHDREEMEREPIKVGSWNHRFGTLPIPIPITTALTRAFIATAVARHPRLAPAVSVALSTPLSLPAIDVQLTPLRGGGESAPLNHLLTRIAWQLRQQPLLPIKATMLHIVTTNS